jgi:MFS family permease
MTALVRSLHHTAFAWLLSGQTLSRIGDYLYQVVLAWWVLQETGSAVAMSSVLILSVAPLIIFGFLGGVAVDRYSRIHVMLLSDLLRGALVGIVAVMAFSDTLQVWHVYIISLLFGIVDSFFQPAFTALVPQLVPTPDLPSANSLSSMSHQLGRIVGPALAGVIIALGGTTLGFTINAASFFISALCLLPLLNVPAASRRMNVASESQTSVWQEAREGLGIVLRTPILWMTVLMDALTNVTLSGPYSVALPFLVAQRWPGNANALGWLYAFFPIGYALSSLWFGRQSVLRRRGLLLYLSTVLAGLGMLVLGLPLPLVVLAAAAVLNGASLEASGLAWANLLQEKVPGEKLGRVASIDMIGSTVFIPVGFAVTGLLTDSLGPASVFILGGGITMLLALLALAHPAIRRLD